MYVFFCYLKMSCCSICIEDMKCASFTAARDDDEIDADDPLALRLKCGHAFHVSCIMASFRATSTANCPTCRPGQSRTMNDVLQEAVDMVNMESDNQFLLADLIRDNVRVRNPAVRKARSHFKKVLKKYNGLAQDLVSNRSRIVREALKSFRAEKKQHYSTQVQLVQNALNSVKHAEREAMLATGDLTEDAVDDYLDNACEWDYRANYVAQRGDENQPDPLDRSFWFR